MAIEYSVVIPIKNEEENISLLIEELEPIMQNLGKPWELIYINDGSTDKSLEILSKLKEVKDYLKIINFSHNFGQTSAFNAGFKKAQGTWVITLDGDRQNDPSDIPLLLSETDDCDLVCGFRKKRNDPALKRIISRIANTVRSRVCQDGVRDTGCSLKVLRRSALNEIKLFTGMHRFLPALFLIEGFRIKEVGVNHREREMGQSKYHFFNRLLGPISDMFAVLWMRKRALNYKVREEI